MASNTIHHEQPVIHPWEIDGGWSINCIQRPNQYCISVSNWSSFDQTETTHPVILFVHGYGGHSFSAYWRSMIETLSKHTVVYSMDLPGHGTTGFGRDALDYFQGKNKLSLADFSEALNDVVDWIPQNNVVIVSHSMGSLTALHFSERYPKQTKVSHIFPISPAIQKDKLDFFLSFGGQQMSKLLPSLSTHAQSLTECSDDVMIDYLQRSDPMEKQDLPFDITVVLNEGWRDLTMKASHPMTMIVANHETLINVDEAKRYCQANQDCQLIVYESMYHCIHNTIGFKIVIENGLLKHLKVI